MKKSKKILILAIIILILIGSWFFPKSKKQCTAVSAEGSSCVQKNCAGIFYDGHYAPTYHKCLGIDLGDGETYFEPNPLYRKLD